MSLRLSRYSDTSTKRSPGNSALLNSRARRIDFAALAARVDQPQLGPRPGCPRGVVRRFPPRRRCASWCSSGRAITPASPWSINQRLGRFVCAFSEAASAEHATPSLIPRSKAELPRLWPGFAFMEETKKTITRSGNVRAVSLVWEPAHGTRGISNVVKNPRAHGEREGQKERILLMACGFP